MTPSLLKPNRDAPLSCSRRGCTPSPWPAFPLRGPAPQAQPTTPNPSVSSGTLPFSSCLSSWMLRPGAHSQLLMNTEKEKKTLYCAFKITLLPRQAASIRMRNLEPQIPPPLEFSMDLFSPFNIAFFSSV